MERQRAIITIIITIIIASVVVIAAAVSTRIAALAAISIGSWQDGRKLDTAPGRGANKWLLSVCKRASSIINHQARWLASGSATFVSLANRRQWTDANSL